MNQFYFVLTNPEAETLFFEELRLRYPEFRRSYSKSGFITLKGVEEVIFKPLFCRLSGISHGSFRKADLHVDRAWVYAVNPELVIPQDLKELSDRTIFKPGETARLVIMTGPDEYWLGSYTLRPDHFQTPGEVSSILEREVPSRAYYKIAEVYEAFDLPFENQSKVLELGSAPGGASLFLLEQDMKVLGVDPADMDPVITKKFDFKHIRRPFETLTEQDLPDDIDWIISDINLPPTVVLKEVHRLLSFLEPRGLIITLKINDMKHLQVVAGVREQFRKHGFDKVELKYLPSHRKEIALIALRS